MTNTLAVADVDSANLSSATVSITSGFVSGEDLLAFTPSNGISGVYNNGTGLLTISGTASLAAYQTALRSVTYRNTNTVNPSTSNRVFSFRANDGSGTNNLSNIVTRTATVTALNAAPVNSVPGAQSTNEDTALVFSSANGNRLSISDSDAGTGSLTATLSITNGVFQESNASTLVLNGTVAQINASLGTLTYVPTPDFFGASTLTITTNDNGNSGSGGAKSDTDTVAITVNPVNDAPSFTPGATVTVDEDSGAYSQAWASNISVGPANESAQTRAFAVTNSNNALFSVQPAIASNGTLSFTPAANQNGSATVRVILSDNGGTANGGSDSAAAVTFTITVNAVNDAPTISAIADQSTNEDTATAAIPFTIGDVETAPAALTVTASSSDTTLVPNANIVLGGSGANRNVTITPAPNQNGSAIITLKVSDGTDTTTRTFALQVLAVNDAPTISAIADQSTDEDTATGAIAFTIGDVETAPADLTVTATSSNTTLVPLANIVFGGSGANRTVTITPAPNQNGGATITVTVSDGDDTTTQTFALQVLAINDAPSFTLAANPPAVDEDSGVQSVSAFATLISPRPKQREHAKRDVRCHGQQQRGFVRGRAEHRTRRHAFLHARAQRQWQRQYHRRVERRWLQRRAQPKHQRAAEFRHHRQRRQRRADNLRHRRPEHKRRHANWRHLLHS